MSAAQPVPARAAATRRPGRPLLARRMKITAGTALLLLAAVYVLVPVYWLLIASTKSSGQLFSTPSFLPPSHLSLGSNLSSLFNYGGGEYKDWFVNSLVYATVTATL